MTQSCEKYIKNYPSKILSQTQNIHHTWFKKKMTNDNKLTGTIINRSVITSTFFYIPY